MKQANDRMTADEQVAFAWRHRSHFEEVRQHNIEVNIRRLKRADWTLPENQYRNAWAELAEAL